MRCPVCHAELPVKCGGYIDFDRLKDMLDRVATRKNFLVLYRQWDFQSAYEQAVQEIFYGADTAL